MQMTRELEKRLRLMRRFNQVGGSLYREKRIYNDKVFVHDGIMYATDGFILVVAGNLTGRKDFSFFRCNGMKFEYLDSSVQEVKKDREALRDGEALEKILQPLNHGSVSFDIDFEGCPLPTELCSGWGKRREDELTVNFQTEEAVVDFCGGLEADGGITGTYGDAVRNVSGTIPGKTMKFAFWHIMEIMKQCRVNRIHVESYPDRHLNTCKVGDYTFLFTDRD